jgi:hypothetical protein
MNDHDLARRNDALGWALFAFFLLLLAGVVAVVFIYLAAD